MLSGTVHTHGVKCTLMLNAISGARFRACSMATLGHTRAEDGVLNVFDSAAHEDLVTCADDAKITNHETDVNVAIRDTISC